MQPLKFHDREPSQGWHSFVGGTLVPTATGRAPQTPRIDTQNC
jgi:hypothetical protein